MVQLPKLERIEPSSSLPKNERIGIQAQNNASSILSNTSAIKGVVEQGAQVYQEAENSKIQNLSQEMEKEFSNWNSQQLAKLKTYEGDPTDAYAQYDSEVKDKYEALIASRPEASERVRRHVTSHLDKVVGNESFQAMKQRGAQQETYENNLFESSVNMKRDNIAINAGHIQKDNPGSYLPFDESINDVKTLISQRAVKKGSATIVDKDSTDFTHMYRDAEGEIIKVKMNDAAKYRTAKELSRGVSDSITSMINSGYSEEAKQAFERYKGYIDPKTKGKLEGKFKKTETVDEAKGLVGQIEAKPEGEHLAEIEKIKDPDVRSEVLKRITTNTNRRKALRNNEISRNYELLANTVMTKMNSSSPFNGLSDLEDSEVYKQTWEKLDNKTRQAITEMVKSPETTNPKSLGKVVNFFASDNLKDIEKMNYTQFASEYLSGLNEKDRAKYSGKFEKLKDPSASAQRAVMSRAGVRLEEKMLTLGTIKLSGYGKGLSTSSIKKLAETKLKMIDYLGDNPGDYNDKQISDKIDEFLADDLRVQAQAKRNSGGLFNSWFGSTPQPQTTVVPVRNVKPTEATPTQKSNFNINDVPIDVLSPLTRQYMKDKGTTSIPKTTDADFQNYVKGKM